MPKSDEMVSVILQELDQEQARVLLQPIVDVCTGADGAAAFSKLRFDFLPDVIAHAHENELAAEMLAAINKVSKLCTLLLERSE